MKENKFNIYYYCGDCKIYISDVTQRDDVSLYTTTTNENMAGKFSLEEVNYIKDYLKTCSLLLHKQLCI